MHKSHWRHTPFATGAGKLTHTKPSAACILWPNKILWCPLTATCFLSLWYYLMEVATQASREESNKWPSTPRKKVELCWQSVGWPAWWQDDSDTEKLTYRSRPGYPRELFWVLRNSSVNIANSYIAVWTTCFFIRDSPRDSVGGQASDFLHLKMYSFPPDSKPVMIVSLNKMEYPKNHKCWACTYLYSLCNQSGQSL